MAKITEDAFTEQVEQWQDELTGLEFDYPGYCIDELERISNEIDDLRRRLENEVKDI